MYRHCASGEVEHGPSMVSHVSHPPFGQSADAPVRLLLRLNTAGLMAPLNFTQVVSVLPPGVVDHAMDPSRRLHGERSTGRRVSDVLFSIVVTQVGSLFAGRQVATHRCNLIEGVVLLTVEHDAHQEGTLRNNGTGAAFIEPALSVHTHSGDTLCAPPSRHLVCKKMPHKNCATQ